MLISELETIGVRLDPCRPPAWARSGHAQTLIAHFMPSPASLPAAEVTRVEIPLPDGDRLVALHAAGTGDCVLLLFHGLTGDASAGYMQRSARLARDLGWGVYLVNHRGCGEGDGLARGPYHSGRAEDLSEAIAFARARHPGKRILAVGFSLGANALLLLLSGRRGRVQPDAAVAINAPIDLEGTSRLLHKGWNLIYDQTFSLGCRDEVRRKQRKGLLDREYRFPLFLTLRDFDGIYTATAGGFASREDYYSTCSTHRALEGVRVPTVLMTAQDDPFIDYRAYVEAKRSPEVRLHVEAVGGHLGFLSGKLTKRGTRRWLDYALGEILPALARQIA